MSEYIPTYFQSKRQGVPDAYEFVKNDGEVIEYVPVVRCRDCRAMRVKYGNVGIECWMGGEPFTVEPDGFCAWGERRGG